MAGEHADPHLRLPSRHGQLQVVERIPQVAGYLMQEVNFLATPERLQPRGDGEHAVGAVLMLQCDRQSLLLLVNVSGALSRDVTGHAPGTGRAGLQGLTFPRPQQHLP